MATPERSGVLAVLDREIAYQATNGFLPGHLNDVRAVVAELIEAASKGATMNVVGTSPALYFGPVHARRLRAALARVQGGAL